MAIRIRVVDGLTIALCAAETDPESGDVYIDDSQHYALAAKFAQDYHGQVIDVEYREHWDAMATQKLRDAQEELEKWVEAGMPDDVNHAVPSKHSEVIPISSERRGLPAPCIVLDED